VTAEPTFLYESCSQCLTAFGGKGHRMILLNANLVWKFASFL